MKDLRMWFIFVFAAICVFWLVYETIKPNIRNVWLCGVFGGFTFLLLFSDLFAQFAVRTPAFEAFAKINELQSNQIKYDTIQTKLIKDNIENKFDVKQLSETVNKILRIIDLEKKRPVPMVMHSPESLKKRSERYDDSINVTKKELENLIR